MNDSRKVLLYVGIGCGALLLSGICLGGATILYCGMAFTEPADFAHAFLADLRNDEMAAAYGKMHPDYRASHDRNAFETEVRAHEELTTHTEATLSERYIERGSARLGGRLDTPNGPVPVRFVVVQFEGAWYVQSLAVDGVPFRGLAPPPDLVRDPPDEEDEEESPPGFPAPPPFPDEAPEAPNDTPRDGTEEEQ